MKTNPKSPRRKKKPEPVVDIDENIFNPFAPVLALFRRRSTREGAKKPRSFRHDFALVLLLHVIGIVAFVAHGSIKRCNATQNHAAANMKKQEKSVVEEIVRSSPGSTPELIETGSVTRPGKHALRAVHEADPFLPEKVTKPSTPAGPEAPKGMAQKTAEKDPPKQTAKATPAATKTPSVVQSPAVSKQNRPSGQAPAPVTNADDANARRAFLDATGRIERPKSPEIQSAAEPEIRRAEPVVRPVQSATRPLSPQIRPATQPTPPPSGAVAWSTQPVDAKAMRTAADAPRNQAGRASEYTVAPGDNLEVISKRLGVGYEQLAAHNNLSSSRDLRVGRKLDVPADTGSF